MFWGFQNCPWCNFYHVWISFNLIFVICFLVKSCKLKYSWFWHLTLRWLFGHYIDFWSKFLLGTKIAHVWEEIELLVISIWEDSDPIKGCCKITHSMENPVEAIFKILTRFATFGSSSRKAWEGFKMQFAVWLSYHTKVRSMPGQGAWQFFN